MDFMEIIIETNIKNISKAEDIACMAAKGGIYTEDYSHLEEEAREIARIDLIDEDLLKKDRSKALIHLYVSPEENPAETIAFLTERLSAENIEHSIKSDVCRNEDWENNWKAYFKPIPVGEKLYIRPEWIDDFDAGDRVVLSIEPGVSFGTGTHETTKLCLEVIEKHIGGRDTLLDVGCGSGILSVAGLLLGAKTAEAVDIDPLAVKMAKQNGALNGFSEPQYKVIEGNLADKIKGKFDLVAANIVADAIMMLSKDVKQFMNPDALYITSGIIDVREQEILDTFDRLGFEIIERHEKGGWLCFVTKMV